MINPRKSCKRFFPATLPDSSTRGQPFLYAEGKFVDTLMDNRF